MMGVVPHPLLGGRSAARSRARVGASTRFSVHEGIEVGPTPCVCSGTLLPAGGVLQLMTGILLTHKNVCEAGER